MNDHMFASLILVGLYGSCRTHHIGFSKIKKTDEDIKEVNRLGIYPMLTLTPLYEPLPLSWEVRGNSMYSLWQFKH